MQQWLLHSPEPAFAFTAGKQGLLAGSRGSCTGRKSVGGGGHGLGREKWGTTEEGGHCEVWRCGAM